MVDQLSMMLNELSVSGGASQSLCGRKWVTRNTIRAAIVAIKVRVYVNHIVGSLLPISKQYFP